jgi:hypothetical protein
MVYPYGLKEVKGAHSLCQQVKKNEIFWFGLLLEGKIFQFFNLFYNHCNLNVYIFSSCDVHRG